MMMMMMMTENKDIVWAISHFLRVFANGPGDQG